MVLVSLSSVFVVPKCTDGLWPILPTFSSLIVIYTSIILRCLLSDMYGNLFSVVIMLSFDLQDAYLHIPILLSGNIIFYDFFGKICHISGKL